MEEKKPEAAMDVPDFTDEEIEEQVDRAVERFKRNIDCISGG